LAKAGSYNKTAPVDFKISEANQNENGDTSLPEINDSC
jgi:hypothetical protein